MIVTVSQRALYFVLPHAESSRPGLSRSSAVTSDSMSQRHIRPSAARHIALVSRCFASSRRVFPTGDCHGSGLASDYVGTGRTRHGQQPRDSFKYKDKTLLRVLFARLRLAVHLRIGLLRAVGETSYGCISFSTFRWRLLIGTRCASTERGFLHREGHVSRIEFGSV